MPEPTRVWLLNRERCALLVIDMTNDFVEEGGLFEVPEARRQIPKIKRLIETCRRVDVPVIFTAGGYWHINLTPRIYEKFPILGKKGLRRGTRGTGIYREIAPKDAEFVVQKLHFSAFFNTELESILRNIKGNKGSVDTLIFCGTVTNICVESSIRDAFCRDYKIVVGEDVCSAFDPDLHSATLKNVEFVFGRVMSCDQIIEILTKGKEEG